MLWGTAVGYVSMDPGERFARFEYDPDFADYLARLGPFDPVFVNGDMMYRHIFVQGGRLSAIIDWGDAIITDRHYELAKLHLDTFDCDKGLLRALLEASDWPGDNRNR